MTIKLICSILGWCSIINIILLLIWFVLFIFFRDPIYKIHSKWFSLKKETFDIINYAGLGVFKIIIFVFNVVPYIVIKFLI